MAVKTAFVLEGFNIRVSEDWVVETVDIELAAHHAVIETSLRQVPQARISPS
jgi:hypothetical protein